MDTIQEQQTDRRHHNPIRSVLDTFRRLNFSNVFHCRVCNKIWMGKDLHKNREGKYVCLNCNHNVEDITNTPLGKAFLQIVMPALFEKRV